MWSSLRSRKALKHLGLIIPKESPHNKDKPMSLINLAYRKNLLFQDVVETKGGWAPRKLLASIPSATSSFKKKGQGVPQSSG